MELVKISNDDRHFLPFYWVVISVILLIADYLSGPFVQFPITYLIPISLASWYNGRSWGISLAVTLSLLRLLFNVVFWKIPWTWVEASINCVIRVAVFSMFVILIDRTASQTRALSKEVKVLSGLLPICSYCKKIRDESGEWEPIEMFISDRSDADFSHSICPECREKYYGEYLRNRT